MRKWLPGIMIIGTACSGHGRPVTGPQTVARRDSTLPGASQIGTAVPVETVADIGPNGVAAERARALAQSHALRDSAANNAALDSLARVQPPSTLPELAIAARPTWDLNVADFADQPRVKYYLDYFNGRAHDRFQIWLDRMGRYEDYARDQFAARKLPGDFVYLALIESGFSPTAVSRTAAVGIWQFMQGTGKMYGLRVDSWLDERRDPIKSTDAAAHHLDDLTQRFGSHYLAAAAYNAGAGRVQRGLGTMTGGTSMVDDSTSVTSDDAFFSLADTRMIRDETKNYVPQLIAAAIIAKEPSRYGFEIAHDMLPFSRDSVIVDGGTGLDLIARLADTTLDALRELNPHLLRMVTPPSETYAVRVPTGTAQRVANAYAALAPADRREVLAHQVRAGETVLTLAHEFDASPDLIRSANRSARGRTLAPGSMVYIPVSVNSATAAMLREPDPPKTLKTITRTVIVRAGESVAAVAKRAGVSVDDLRSDNRLAAHATLHKGQRLITRRTMLVAAKGTVVATSSPRTANGKGSRVAAATVTAEPAPVKRTGAAKQPATTARDRVAVRTHVVRKGETVTAIADKFGVPASALIALNRLGKGGRVQAGQTLKIPG